METEKKHSVPYWLRCCFDLVPWSPFILVGLGFLPEYFWWIATGDSKTALDMLKLFLRVSLILVIVYWGVVIILVPFWIFGGTWLEPPKKEYWSMAVCGSFVLGMAAALGVVMAGKEALLAARAGTAVFFMMVPAARAVQKAIERQLKKETAGSSDQESK